MSLLYKCTSVTKGFEDYGFVVGQYYQGAVREVSNDTTTVGLKETSRGHFAANHVTDITMIEFVEV